MNEPQWIEKDRAENPNRNPMPESSGVLEDTSPEMRSVSDFEAQTGIPYIVDRLRIGDDFRIDPMIEAKALAVDEFIRNQALSDNTQSYDMVLTKFFDNLPEPIERIVTTKGGVRVLERMFTEASISQQKSSDGYLEEYRQKLAIQKVASLKQQLKIALNAI